MCVVYCMRCGVCVCCCVCDIVCVGYVMYCVCWVYDVLCVLCVLSYVMHLCVVCLVVCILWYVCVWPDEQLCWEGDHLYLVSFGISCCFFKVSVFTCAHWVSQSFQATDDYLFYLFPIDPASQCVEMPSQCACLVLWFCTCTAAFPPTSVFKADTSSSHWEHIFQCVLIPPNIKTQMIPNSEAPSYL